MTQRVRPFLATSWLPANLVATVGTAKFANTGCGTHYPLPRTELVGEKTTCPGGPWRASGAVWLGRLFDVQH